MQLINSTSPQYPAFLAAVQGAEGLDLAPNEVENIAYHLSVGECGTVVKVWGRELAKRLVSSIESIGDADCTTALKLAVEQGVSWDGLGHLEFVETPARAAETEACFAWIDEGFGLPRSKTAGPK